MPKTHPFSTQIAGAYYRDSAAQTALAEADRDTAVQLVPEPDNPYDSNAIAVYVERYVETFDSDVLGIGYAFEDDVSQSEPIIETQLHQVGYIPRNHCENVLVMLPTLTRMYIENSTLHLVYTDPTSV